MPFASSFTLCQQLVVQSIDLASLIGRDILQMQGSQLMFGWLVVVPAANRPRTLVEQRGALCRCAVYRKQRRQSQYDPKNNLEDDLDDDLAEHCSLSIGHRVEM